MLLYAPQHSPQKQPTLMPPTLLCPMEDDHRFSKITLAKGKAFSLKDWKRPRPPRESIARIQRTAWARGAPISWQSHFSSRFSRLVLQPGQPLRVPHEVVLQQRLENFHSKATLLFDAMRNPRYSCANWIPPLSPTLPRTFLWSGGAACLFRTLVRSPGWRGR